MKAVEKQILRGVGTHRHAVVARLRNMGEAIRRLIGHHALQQPLSVVVKHAGGSSAMSSALKALAMAVPSAASPKLVK